MKNKTYWEEELEAILIYCKAARKAEQLSLCKLVIRDEIQLRAQRLLNLCKEK